MKMKREIKKMRESCPEFPLWQQHYFDLNIISALNTDNQDASYQDSNYHDTNYQDANYQDANYQDNNHQDANYQDNNYQDANYRNARYAQVYLEWRYLEYFYTQYLYYYRTLVDMYGRASAVLCYEPVLCKAYTPVLVQVQA